MASYEVLKRSIVDVELDINILHARPDHVMALSLLKRENPRVFMWGSDKAASSLGNERVRRRMVRMNTAVSDNFYKGVLGMEPVIFTS